MANDFIGEHRLTDVTISQQANGLGDAGIPVGSPGELRQLRISKRESQEKFWGRFGVTQSSGSRFETGLSIPAPVAILLKLYVKGKLSDVDLRE